MLTRSAAAGRLLLVAIVILGWWVEVAFPLTTSASAASAQQAASAAKRKLLQRRGASSSNSQDDAACNVISPKVMIISMFQPEEEIWYGSPVYDILAQNVTVPGLSSLYPDVHCTADGVVCQFTTGEGEINAAATVQALVLSPAFNLSTTYFLIAGIAGVNPEVATIGAVTFARWTVQVDLEYEFDAREIPSNWSTGYLGQGAYAPGEYPTFIYGTEVFELNDALRSVAMGFAQTAVLNDTADMQNYRAKYNTSSAFTAGAQPPNVVACDVATSDVYFSGALLGDAFSNFTSLMTNGSGVYCTTGQEDNATLEALLRGAALGLLDYARVILMRTASDFDRPYPGSSPQYNLFYAADTGFDAAVQNIYLAGLPIVQGIVEGWDSLFHAGINATNYLGDIFGTLGGTPDFGQGTALSIEEALAKRDADMEVDEPPRRLNRVQMMLKGRRPRWIGA